MFTQLSQNPAREEEEEEEDSVGDIERTQSVELMHMKMVKLQKE